MCQDLIIYLKGIKRTGICVSRRRSCSIRRDGVSDGESDIEEEG